MASLGITIEKMYTSGRREMKIVKSRWAANRRLRNSDEGQYRIILRWRNKVECGRKKGLKLTDLAWCVSEVYAGHGAWGVTRGCLVNSLTFKWLRQRVEYKVELFSIRAWPAARRATLFSNQWIFHGEGKKNLPQESVFVRYTSRNEVERSCKVFQKFNP